MNDLNLSRCALGICASVAVLAGCNSGGSNTASQLNGTTLLPTSNQISPATGCRRNGCIYVGVVAGGVSQPVYSSLLVFPKNANGNVAPIDSISGENTGLDYPYGVAVGAARDSYVANFNCCELTYPIGVTVYAPGAHGNAAPVRSIGGTKAGVDQPDGIALDSSGHSYVANFGDGTVTVYAPGAHGNVAPLRTLKIGAKYPIGPGALALNADRNIYVTTVHYCNPFHHSCSGTDSVLEYAPGARGNATPIAIISGSKTGLAYPQGVALDATGKIYVANYHGNSLTVYARGANGNVASIRTIKGSKTGLSEPFGVALGSGGNIYVTNYASVTVYAARANGNVAPIQNISGSLTGFGGQPSGAGRPFGITVR